MIVNGKDLYSFIDNILKPQGYIRKKDTWYFHTPECICFFSIGKSQFSGKYEHVMGCFLKELYKEKEEFPKYYKNNLKFSLDSLADSEQVKKVFNLENVEFKGNEREQFIKDYIENYAIPFLNDVNTKNNIKKAVLKYEDLKYSMDGDLRDILGIILPDD